MNYDHFPTHPLTGLRAIGFRKTGQPIWPCQGGAPDDDPDVRSLTYEAAGERMQAIHARLEELNGKHRLSRANESEARDLMAEWDAVDAHRQSLLRRAELARMGGNGGGNGYRTIAGSQQASDFGDDDDEHPLRGLRSTAMRSVDAAVTASRLPARAAETVEHLLTTGPDVERSWVARWITETGNESYRSAFARMLLHGEARAGLEFSNAEREAFQRVSRLKGEQRAMSLTDNAGGYLVPYELDPTIILTSGGSINPLLQISRVVNTVSDVWHGVSSSGVTAEWLAEATEAADGSPTLAEPAIPSHKMSVFVPFSVELEGDASALLTELARLMADGAQQLLNTALTTGSGNGQPTGIVTALTGTASVVPSIGADTFAAADLYAVQNALPARFSANAQWASSLAILNAARQFESTNGAIKFPELSANPPMLLGRPVHELSNLDGVINAGADNYVAVYGDWSHFPVTQRVGSQVELISHLMGENGRPTGQRGVWLWGRWGSDSVADNAFRMLNVT